MNTKVYWLFRKEIAMNRRKGFTLIELLIVILILGALAAIAIPRITASADTAKKNACATNLDLINSQIEMYAANNGGTYPATLKTVTASTTYFPDGEPNCPFGTAYIMSGNRVTAHVH
jgi:general secretion pathway protein G